MGDDVYRLTFERAAVGIGHVAPDGRWLRFNSTLCAFLGYAPDELARLTFTDTTHPDDIGEDWRQARRVLAGDIDSYDLEKRYIRKDGSTAWAELHVSLIRDSRGAPLYFISIIEDISARKRAQAELGRVQRQLDAILEALPEGVNVADMTGRVLRVNRAGAELLGYVSEAEFQRPLPEFVDTWELAHDDGRPMPFEEWPFLRVLRGERLDGCVVKIRRVDTGLSRTLSYNGRLVEEPGGTLALLTFRDVTHVREVERELRRRERELQSIADNSPDIIARFDRELRHVFVNRAVERVTGIPVAAYIGRTNRELGMPQELCDQWDAALRRVFEHREPQELEFEFAGNRGTRLLSAVAVPEPIENGSIPHVLAVAHDITSSRKAERELRDADRRKNDFLATLAHELRNPLASLRSGLDLLGSSTGTEADVSKARDTMDRQLVLMARLVNDLLDVARIGQGKLELQRDRVLLQTIIGRAVEIVQPAIERAGHQLSVCEDLPVWVDGDRDRLAQVVTNLLNNASKYTPSGGRIEVAISIEGTTASIAVTDNGLGISAERLPHIFDMYAQEQRTLERAQGGLGIGLSLVRQLVTMHGGQVEARSAGAGKGSTFIIRLPAVPPPDAGREQVEVAAARTQRAWRILVIDDNADAAELLTSVLELDGHRASAVFSGRDGVRAAREAVPDVIFLDIGLPDLDGYEVLRELRQMPELDRVAVVALTGWGAADEQQRSREVGFDLHLTKPVSAARIREFLRALER